MKKRKIEQRKRSKRQSMFLRDRKVFGIFWLLFIVTISSTRLKWTLLCMHNSNEMTNVLPRLHFWTVKAETDLKYHRIEKDAYFEIISIQKENRDKEMEKNLLIFDLFICIPIIRNVFWDKYLMKKQKLICFLFCVCFCLLLNWSWSFQSPSISFTLGVVYWKVCFSMNFQWNVIIRDFLDSKIFSQIKGVFQMRSMVFCLWNGIEIRF